jgi:2-methylisocitrate lyase-like PEP mutase family enzyme
VAEALGYEDGERTPSAEMLAALGVAPVSFGGGLAHTALEAAAAEVEDFVSR